MDFKSTYINLFNNISYNQHSDDEFRFEFVLEFLIKNKELVASILDVGSGRGNLLKILLEKFHDIKISSADLSKFHNLNSVPFYNLNLCEVDTLSNIPNFKFDLITCLDVLEHLNENCLELALNFLSTKCKFAIFSIANHSDIQNGIEVHLIQKDINFWKTKLKPYFDILEIREKYEGRLYLLNLKSKIL